MQMSGPWIRRPKCSVQLGFHQNPETWPLPVLWVLTHWGRGSEWEHLKRQHWREREGPEVTLFDLAWEVTQHHFCHILGDCESLGLTQHQRQELGNSFICDLSRSWYWHISPLKFFENWTVPVFYISLSILKCGYQKPIVTFRFLSRNTLTKIHEIIRYIYYFQWS